MQMRFIDWRAIGNAGAIANAGREVAKRSTEDAVVSALVAALAAGEAPADRREAATTRAA